MLKLDATAANLTHRSMMFSCQQSRYKSSCNFGLFKGEHSIRYFMTGNTDSFLGFNKQNQG